MWFLYSFSNQFTRLAVRSERGWGALGHVQTNLLCVKPAVVFLVTPLRSYSFHKQNCSVFSSCFYLIIRMNVLRTLYVSIFLCLTIISQSQPCRESVNVYLNVSGLFVWLLGTMWMNCNHNEISFISQWASCSYTKHSSFLIWVLFNFLELGLSLSVTSIKADDWTASPLSTFFVSFSQWATSEYLCEGTFLGEWSEAIYSDVF